MGARYAIPVNYRTDAGSIDVAKIKADFRVSDVAGKLTKLVRTGNEYKGLCPLHEERSPSFYVNDEKALYHCFGCGRGGDVIDLVRRIGGGTFLEACEWLVGCAIGHPSERRPMRNAAARRALNVALAKSEWRRTRPITGTPAEAYLALRGLIGRMPGSIRFGMTPRYFDEATGKPGPRAPALIAACQDVDGAVTGIQRLFLTSGGRKARGEARLSLGQIRGGALRLGPEASQIIICEGLEDGLSLMRMFPGATVWVALGTGNMPHMALPDCVRRVLLAGDEDGPGRAAVEGAEASLRSRSIEVEKVFPRAGKDFNEEWLMLHA